MVSNGARRQTGTAVQIIHHKQLCGAAAGVNRWLYSYVILYIVRMEPTAPRRMADTGKTGSPNPFEDPPIVFGTTSVENMALNVFVPEDPLGINFLEDVDKVVKVGI